MGKGRSACTADNDIRDYDEGKAELGRDLARRYTLGFAARRQLVPAAIEEPDVSKTRFHARQSIKFDKKRRSLRHANHIRP